MAIWRGDQPKPCPSLACLRSGRALPVLRLACRPLSTLYPDPGRPRISHLASRMSNLRMRARHHSPRARWAQLSKTKDLRALALALGRRAGLDSDVSPPTPIHTRTIVFDHLLTIAPGFVHPTDSACDAYPESPYPVISAIPLSHLVSHGDPYCSRPTHNKTTRNVASTSSLSSSNIKVI